MTLDPNALEKLTRDELIQHARELGAKRPELLTRPELRDEIIRLTVTETDEQRRARGWFGVARDLVASVVGQGLNLPDAADLIRGVHVFSPIPAPPVATVTLAEIYAAQGHLKKALDLLDEVLEKEPDHLAARQARERWAKAAAPSESTGIGTKAEPVASEPPADSVWFDESITQEVPSQPGHDEATANPPDAISAPDATAPAQATPYDVEPSLATATPIEPSPLGLSAAEKANPDNAFTSIETADPREAAPEQGVSSETASREAAPEQGASSETASREAAPEQGASSETASSETCVAEAAPSKCDLTSEGRPQNLVLFFRMPDGSCWCHWRLSRDSLPRDPENSPVLRIVEVEGSWEGPTTDEHSLTIEQATGCRRLSIKSPESELRVALGQTFEGVFSVLAVGAEFVLPGIGALELRFAPPASMSEQAWRDAGRQAVTEVLRAQVLANE